MNVKIVVQYFSGWLSHLFIFAMFSRVTMFYDLEFRIPHFVH
jgi:hypothetical protein